MLSDDQKKMLTEEIFGECWHKMERIHPGGIFKRCHKCLRPESMGIHNRTFTSWQDLGDLKENIVMMGEWESFLIYAASTFSPDREMKNFTNYLLDPTRFSELVARWWEERKVKEGEGMKQLEAIDGLYYYSDDIKDTLKKLGEMLTVFSNEHKRCLNCERSWNSIRDLIKQDSNLQVLLSINWNKRRVI